MTWLKNGKVLKPKKKDKRIKIDWNISDDTYFLEIHEATTEDCGTYTARVCDRGGSVETNVDVCVTLPVVEKNESTVSETVEEAPAKKQEEPEVKQSVAEDKEKDKNEDKKDIVKPKFSKSPKATKLEEGDEIKLIFKLVEGSIITIWLQQLYLIFRQLL